MIPILERDTLLLRLFSHGLLAALLLALFLVGLAPVPALAQRVLATDSLSYSGSEPALAAEIQGLIDTAIDEEDGDRKEAVLLDAQAIASRWVDADPNSAEAHYWLAATLGLRAETSGPRSKIRLGREAFAVAERGVELDSLHAGSLHVLGRVHAGARRLNWFTRLIAGRFGLGEVLDAASWESAEALLARAVELEPDNPVFRFELGSFYYDRENEERAREHLLSVLASPGFTGLPTSAQRRTCEMLEALESPAACAGGPER